MMVDFAHGLTGYTYHKCRCDVCKAANSAYHRERREIRRANMPADVEHGKASTYVNYCCRCEPCKEANSAYHKERK